jgi:hypothetical protein
MVFEGHLSAIGPDWSRPGSTGKIITMQLPGGQVDLHVGTVPTSPFEVMAGNLVAFVVCQQ